MRTSKDKQFKKYIYGAGTAILATLTGAIYVANQNANKEKLQFMRQSREADLAHHITVKEFEKDIQIINERSKKNTKHIGILNIKQAETTVILRHINKQLDQTQKLLESFINFKKIATKDYINLNEG